MDQIDGNFAILRTELGEILLNGIGGKAGDKPPRYQGPRVEFGIVVDDLKSAFAAAERSSRGLAYRSAARNTESRTVTLAVFRRLGMI